MKAKEINISIPKWIEDQDFKYLCRVLGEAGVIAAFTRVQCNPSITYKVLRSLAKIKENDATLTPARPDIVLEVIRSACIEGFYVCPITSKLSYGEARNLVRVQREGTADA